MTARDPYYNLVKKALRQEGWRITHNPLRLRKPVRRTQGEPGEAAEEPLLAAEKDERKIAVVIKSFVGRGGMVFDPRTETIVNWNGRSLVEGKEGLDPIVPGFNKDTYVP